MPSTGEGAGRHWPSNFLEYLINGHLMNRLFGGVKARNLDFRKKKVGFSDAALWISNLLAKGMALQRCNQCIFLSHVATKLYNPTSCGASARHRPPPFSRFFFFLFPSSDGCHLHPTPGRHRQMRGRPISNILRISKICS